MAFVRPNNLLNEFCDQSVGQLNPSRKNTVANKLGLTFGFAVQAATVFKFQKGEIVDLFNFPPQSCSTNEKEISAKSIYSVVSRLPATKTVGKRRLEKNRFRHFFARLMNIVSQSWNCAPEARCVRSSFRSWPVFGQLRVFDVEKS
jgi:hypothetical protein